MTSINRVQILGNLGRDPEIKTFGNGGRVANLSIATTETWKDRTTGEKRESTEWHTVAVFLESSIKLCERLSKGARVVIDGKLETRKWTDTEGKERYSTEIIVRAPGAHNIGPLSSFSAESGSDAAVPHENIQGNASSDDPYPF